MAYNGSGIGDSACHSELQILAKTFCKHFANAMLADSSIFFERWQLD